MMLVCKELRAGFVILTRNTIPHDPPNKTFQIFYNWFFFFMKTTAGKTKNNI